MRLAQRLPPAGRPRLVAVLGQQLAAVERGRRAEVRDRARLPGAGHRGVEGVDVDVHPAARAQHEHVVAQGQDGRAVGAGRLERPAGDVQGLVEVVRRRVAAAVGPQQLRGPLAVDPAVGRQREQLDQALGLPQAPGALGHGGPADANREGTEQADLHGLGHVRLRTILREPRRPVTVVTEREGPRRSRRSTRHDHDHRPDPRRLRGRRGGRARVPPLGPRRPRGRPRRPPAAGRGRGLADQGGLRTAARGPPRRVLRLATGGRRGRPRGRTRRRRSCAACTSARGCAGAAPAPRC